LLTDLWIARVLAVAAIGLVVLVGVRHALDQPIYGPIDEAYHAGYVQRVADTGVPPMLGRDEIILAHPAIAVGSVSLPGPEAGTAPLPFGDHFQMTQGEAIQPPLYYYLLAPVAWFTHGSDKIYALRIASCALNAIGVLLLFLMLRAVLPREPLAAGIAAVVLASFTGITHLLSQVQNDALLLPVCVLLLWAFLHDLERRRVSIWHGLAAGAAAATQLIAVPLGAVTLAVAAVYAAGRVPRWRELRQLVWPAAAFVAPLWSWIALNIYRYHALFPQAAGPPGSGPVHSTAGELFSRTFQLFHTAEWISLDTSYAPMFPPGPPDGRPMGLLGVATCAALAIVLWRRRPDSREIGIWVGLVVGTFVLTFLATMINAARSGSTGEISGIFVGRYFVATLAAISGAVGITVCSALAGRDIVRRPAAVAMCGALIYFSLTSSSII
jgi:4-amino-4-deoxy-L-arabinose transferase-like glycosyltransferase